MLIGTLLSALGATVPVPVATVCEPAAPVQMAQADVAAWLDGLMPYALQRGDIAGAVVVVVKDGATLVAKGYGYADVATRRRVDPDITAFRPGSIAKLFTWTAVMQLVERGRVGLDRDVNEYLDFRIPEREGKPITLRELMTHTAGFEERDKSLITTDPARLAPLGIALKRWVPEGIYAPGSTPAYSNYGTALAGYIVERVSGVPFEQYVREHILEPLGMTHSTYDQPPPPAVQALMSNGYSTASGAPQPREYLELVPAGALLTTGTDMARFMIAHLQNGRFGDQQILRTETAREMHDTPYTVIPGIDRALLGFYEHNINGHRVIAHAGDSQWFHSELNLYPDDNVGLFFSFNSAGAGRSASALRIALFQSFGDRYLPAHCVESRPSELPTAGAHGRMIAGVYENSRASRSNFRAVLGAIGQTEVVLNADRTITLPRTTAIDGRPKRWREVAPFVWQEMDGPMRLAAQVADGRVNRFGVEPTSPYSVYERAPWWRASSWLKPAVYTSMTLLALHVVAWLVVTLIRRVTATGNWRQRDVLAEFIVAGFASISLLVLAGWRAILRGMETDIDMLSPQTDGWLWLLQGLGLIAFVGTVAATLWNLRHGWRARDHWASRLWSCALAAASTVILWMAVVCKLLAFSVDY